MVSVWVTVTTCDQMGVCSLMCLCLMACEKKTVKNPCTLLFRLEFKGTGIFVILIINWVSFQTNIYINTTRQLMLLKIDCNAKFKNHLLPLELCLSALLFFYTLILHVNHFASTKLTGWMKFYFKLRGSLCSSCPLFDLHTLLPHK